MIRAATITISFTDWWLSGTGRAGVGDVDAVPHTDRYGCPALPMTQVKGQLRETAMRLAEAGSSGWDELLVHRLFGWRPRELDEPPLEGLRKDGLSGALAFRGNATLPVEVARWFADKANAAARKVLVKRIAATRIDPLGVAKDDTLRAVEAAVPMELTGTILWIGDDDPPANWVRLLDAACAATIAFGKLKTDGFGRAIATCEPKT